MAVAVARASSPRVAARWQVPADLLPFEAQQAFAGWLARRLAILHKYEVFPARRYGSDSAPLPPERALHVLAPSRLRRWSLAWLRALLGIEIERMQTLLLGVWDDPPRPVCAEPAAWQVALTGALRRIGQVYQELERRKSAEVALAALREEIDALPV
jgi:hypothetical protein